MLKKVTGPTILTPFVDELPIPQVLRVHANRDGDCPNLRITMDKIEAQLHSALPPTQVWGYNQQFPGPTVEVRRGTGMRVEWVNQLHDALPFATTLAADPAEGKTSCQNDPGSNGEPPQPGLDAIEPWTVVHLHGGKTPPDSDGSPENMLLPGQSKLCTYPNDQRATALWYHDHGLNITRLNVYAGLAGFWMIRDAADDAINAAVDKHEIPVLIQDRNLETDGDGHLTGQMLHKIEDSTREFFGPYTLVNGKIWPHTHVQARPYRLRLLNGSNARVYRLVLLDENDTPVNDAILQIGTDGGLLGQPVPFGASDGLVLAPAERADILVDFSRFRGKRVRFVNTAGAPYHFPEYIVATPGDIDLEKRVPHPQVMEFRVGTHGTGKSFANLNLPAPLSDFVRLTHNTPHTEHRWVALVEDTDMHMLTLRELVPVADTYAGPAVEIQDGTKPLARFRVGARQFEDTVNFFVTTGATEVWKFVNLTEDVHPLHVHLVQFQALSRQKVTNPGAFKLPTDTTDAGVPLLIDADSVEPDANEQGWKDTLRVNPAEVVAIMATFDGYLGRYMYHCHIIEHEDSEMMRPFVVLPEPIAMAMEDMTGGSHTHGM
jgi:spore coat protein A